MGPHVIGTQVRPAVTRPISCPLLVEERKGDKRPSTRRAPAHYKPSQAHHRAQQERAETIDRTHARDERNPTTRTHARAHVPSTRERDAKSRRGEGNGSSRAPPPSEPFISRLPRNLPSLPPLPSQAPLPALLPRKRHRRIESETPISDSLPSP